MIEKLLARKQPGRELYNLNIPISALSGEPPKLAVVPMDVTQYWERFEKRENPFGRTYYWLTGRPDPRQPKQPESDEPTDLKAVKNGLLTLTPLDYDLTKTALMREMQSWSLHPDPGPLS